jgi:hypothetical protein
MLLIQCHYYIYYPEQFIFRYIDCLCVIYVQRASTTIQGSQFSYGDFLALYIPFSYRDIPASYTASFLKKLLSFLLHDMFLKDTSQLHVLVVSRIRNDGLKSQNRA